METILINIILLLGVVWLILGIAYLWKVFQDSATQSGKITPGRKENRQGESPKPAVSQEQTDNARHILVGRSKPFVSPSVPEVPAVSPTENPAEKPGTFAGENPPVPEETEDAEGTAEENGMQIDYTMDEPDEDSIVREELQIADDAMPEVSPSAILARDLVRVNGWHKNDDALDGVNEAEVRDTLQSIRGTQLMDYIKETTLKQEKDHQKLLAAIRKAEEAEMMSEETTYPDNDTTQDGDDVSEEADRPLSYYL
ncbi:hypothetical protein [Prevotella sp. KH2C16]|uniref:hypothetical protein n=1 Tax=Prevotella sp. KH2C16 TaxID=1855325 RepID=UPI0008E62ED5|nr:hypothetical protein [Prevotella sp. KH2C16]SFG48301.1 hypothetical protein SAMN05216383_11634 [Prevotella sp. KH2C16]SFG70810.1 hypothetical protein SAMN05216383_13112 [Prevotella sp. KH2C16]